jgi:hypothetical protein
MVFDRRAHPPMTNAVAVIPLCEGPRGFDSESTRLDMRLALVHGEPHAACRQPDAALHGTPLPQPMACGASASEPISDQKSCSPLPNAQRRSFIAITTPRPASRETAAVPP